MKRLSRSFFEPSAVEVAPQLLNNVLVAPGVTARIVEVEAYTGSDDPGSHAFRGPTPRNEVMFGRPGHLYVYFTYGMHWCANVVCGPVGEPGAVLLRAVEPLSGLDVMGERRSKAHREIDLANGPAKLTQAMGFDGAHNGLDLCRDGAVVRLADDGLAAPARPDQGVRVGLSRGADIPWRWAVPGNRFVGRPAPTMPR